MPVTLVAGHDEGGAGADRAEAADDQPVDALVGQQIAGAVFEAVAVVVAGIVAEAADDDVGIGDLLVEGHAPEGAFEVVVHDDDL